jgi:transcriptional regulator with XRE-family HTH domain
VSRKFLTIEFARRSKHWSQQTLGSNTRIGAYLISLVENARAIPSDDQRKRLANALGVPPEKLLDPVELPAEAAVASEARR